MAGVSGWLPLEVEESLKLKWFALVKKKKTNRKSKKKNSTMHKLISVFFDTDE